MSEAGGSDRGRAQRLDALKALLADRDITTAAELADELGVSLRTVQRDLATLRHSGMPIEGDRGRGGGTRLERGWSLGRVHLNESEALGLLLSLNIAEKIGSPLLLGDLRSIMRKVGNAFAPAQTRRIKALRNRVLVGQAASAAVLAGYRPPEAAVTRALLTAFMYQRVASLRYQDQSGVTTDREIEAQFLYHNVPVWYALAWDRLRDGVRFFRIDRIQQITVLDIGFRLRPAHHFLTAGESEARSM
ncbi:putative DNA-binding transcriptional regulator YafY [Streptosporangium becharense]|uniref:Putative DNA-binding transcriptional regulator YafY n=1 Tax=Streptosporangium becharense TaxID=1816182 RepID=A0A7W9IAN1_9ACTN|nr:WYL domain-containing protein [Streptosporangium becharense]MBB2915599.1 putative DNA-binding transcriptional regulator YafY [Streptosporangium becharense]MBB5817040.1 putative DNA-binding transcriptional regulator YafY [Streptosporangium becharense]